jgi:predicted phage terminase large subunit-like protein
VLVPFMLPEAEQSLAELVAMSPEMREKWMSRFNTPDALERLKFHWDFWGRPSQFPPKDDWSIWLILAGRGFGKTRTGAEWVRDNMCGDTPLTGGRWRHIALIAETASDARHVMVGDGKATSDPKAGSGLLQIHPKDFRPVYEPSKRQLTWPNGAVALIYNGTEPNQLRGPQHDAAWCDELAKWQYAQEAWDQLQFGLRTGSNPQVCITTTPRPIGLLKQIISDPGTVVTRGSTFDNRSNLSPKFLNVVERKYDGSRLGRQELYAEFLEDVEGALWKRSLIDALRVMLQDVPPLERIVVAIDPNASSQEDANECGMVCAGLGSNGHAYVLDDISGPLSPTEWARSAVSLYHERRADRIVAETNNGGEMVENTLRMIDPNVSYRAVWASRGKVTRAEPISALYEQGRVHHVGAFPRLEDQMCAFTIDFDRVEMGYSPDRVDALVWALTELMIDNGERRLLIA